MKRYAQAVAVLMAVVFGLFSSRIDSEEVRSSEEGLFVRVPDPLSGENPPYPTVPQEIPEAAVEFRDAAFGTKLTRVTQGIGVRHEYSRFDPFNVDQSLIILHDYESGDFRVYRCQKAAYNTDSNLVATVNVEEPRWDPVDPNLIWGFRDFQILTVDPRAGKTTVVKDFAKDSVIGPILKKEPDLYRITTKDEGESSLDKRYWALLLQGSEEDYRLRYVFTWDRQEDRVLGTYEVSAKDAEIDWVGMSPLGRWVLIGADEGSGKHAGLTVADKTLRDFRRLAPSTAHSDVGLDVDGNDVIVMQNTQTDAIDLIPLAAKTGGAAGPENNAGAEHTPLVRLFYADDSPLGFQSGIHVSCNTPGYCVVSTYIEPGVKERNWLDRAIILLRLDRRRPEAFYLAKIHNTTGAYWEETQATITCDGSKVVWASNWNHNVGQERVFLMQLDMPKDWKAR